MVTRCILELGGRQCQQSSNLCFVFRGFVLPVRPDVRPSRAQSLFVGVAVLGDDGLDAFGVFDEQAESGRRAIVLNINAVFAQIQRVKQIIRDRGEMVEGVAKICRRRLV